MPELAPKIVSENVFQNLGGRPKEFYDDIQLRHVVSMDLASASACRRTKINAWYVLTAYESINYSKRHQLYHWLTECSYSFGSSKFKRKELLVAVGRTKNKAAARIFARELCRLKPSVRVGQKLIREWHDLWQCGMAVIIVDNMSKSRDTSFRDAFFMAKRVIREWRAESL